MGKTKTKKDKRAPKGKRSAFIYFSIEERPKVAAESAQSFSEIGKAVAERWHALTPEQKEKYENMAAEDEKRYNEEMAAYEELKNKEKQEALTRYKGRLQDGQSEIQTLESKLQQISHAGEADQQEEEYSDEEYAAPLPFGTDSEGMLNTFRMYVSQLPPVQSIAYLNALAMHYPQLCSTIDGQAYAHYLAAHAAGKKVFEQMRTRKRAMAKRQRKIDEKKNTRALLCARQGQMAERARLVAAATSLQSVAAAVQRMHTAGTDLDDEHECLRVIATTLNAHGKKSVDYLPAIPFARFCKSVLEKQSLGQEVSVQQLIEMWSSTTPYARQPFMRQARVAEVEFARKYTRLVGMTMVQAEREVEEKMAPMSGVMIDFGHTCGAQATRQVKTLRKVDPHYYAKGNTRNLLFDANAKRVYKDEDLAPTAKRVFAIPKKTRV